MPDIVTGKTFVDGEKGITATKMNQIISQAVIQPSFVTSKPSSSTLDPTDQMLEVKGAGTYATITGQQLIDSVSASVTQNIQPTIWSVRLRSFNAVGNPTMECDQKNVGALTTVTASNRAVDRWYVGGAGTWAAKTQQLAATGAELVVPGTNFAISQNFLRFTLTTAQATLAATDNITIWQNVEGPQFRELQFDVHSAQLLVRSSVSGLKFGLSLQDPTTSRSLVKLCTIPSANTWILLTFPNLPIWVSSGTFSRNPGTIGYFLDIALAAGTTRTVPANDTWQNGNFTGAIGQDNFASNALNSTFDIAFCQHEPGALCSTPMDCQFTQNYDECERYFQKTYDLAVKPGTGSTNGRVLMQCQANNAPFGYIPFKKRMAKVPTITSYSANDGAVNTVYDNQAAGNRAVSSVISTGETGYGGLGLATVNTVLASYTWQHTADTGW